MSFFIPSETPRPTDQELEDPDLLHAYFEKNFATTPQLKEELVELTDGFCFDSYESFTQHLSTRGIIYESPSWTGRAGGSGVHGSSQTWTRRDTPVATAKITAPDPIPSTPFATPQMALDGLKKNLTLHYQKTYKGLEQLLEPCEREGSVMLGVPNIVAGGFSIFTQAMIQGRENAITGLKNVLKSYAGMMGPERDSAAEALYHDYERVFTTALGPQWRDAAEFKAYVTQFKADGNGSVNVLGMDPFVNIEPSTYDFTYSLFQKHPEALLELGKIKDSNTFDVIDTKVNDQMVRVSRTLREIAAIKTPDHLYDLIHNFANYSPARKYIYDYLGITEDMVIQGQTQVGGTKRVRDPDDPEHKGYILVATPDQKPQGMDDQTWNLVTCLARRKTAIERGETAFFVLSIGGSILAGVAAGTAAGVLSGGNPIVAGYAASATAMAAAGMIGTHMVNGALQEREWGGAGQAAAVFSGVPLGSNEMVTFLDEKVKYTMISAAGNVVLAGAGAGAATKITMLLEGQIVKRIAVQALYGALDGTASMAIDGNVNNQERLTQATVLAGGKAEDAPTVTQVFFTAAILGGTIGGTAEAVFNPGEMKIALELSTGKLKFYDAAGKLIPVKACAKVQGGVYKVTNTNGEVAYFRVDENNVGVAINTSKAKPKEESKPEAAKEKDPLLVSTAKSREPESIGIRKLGRAIQASPNQNIVLIQNKETGEYATFTSDIAENATNPTFVMEGNSFIVRDEKGNIVSISKTKPSSILQGHTIEIAADSVSLKNVNERNASKIPDGYKIAGTYKPQKNSPEIEDWLLMIDNADKNGVCQRIIAVRNDNGNIVTTKITITKNSDGGFDIETTNMDWQKQFSVVSLYFTKRRLAENQHDLENRHDSSYLADENETELYNAQLAQQQIKQKLSAFHEWQQLISNTSWADPDLYSNWHLLNHAQVKLSLESFDILSQLPSTKRDVLTKMLSTALTSSEAIDINKMKSLLNNFLQKNNISSFTNKIFDVRLSPSGELEIRVIPTKFKEWSNMCDDELKALESTLIRNNKVGSYRIAVHYKIPGDVTYTEKVPEGFVTEDFPENYLINPETGAIKRNWNAFQRAICKLLSDYGLPTDLIYAQGSRVAGKPRVDSDLDIGVYVDNATYLDLCHKRLSSLSENMARKYSKILGITSDGTLDRSDESKKMAAFNIPKASNDMLNFEVALHAIAKAFNIDLNLSVVPESSYYFEGVVRPFDIKADEITQRAAG